jgi:hypothetical protein
MTDDPTPNDGSNPSADSDGSDGSEDSTDAERDRTVESGGRTEEAGDRGGSTTEDGAVEPHRQAERDDSTVAHDGDQEYPSDRATQRGKEGPADPEREADSGRLPDAETNGPTRRPRTEPHVSVTIEGEYETVFERLEHPEAVGHSELDAVVDNIEETLSAVVRTGGGIRSEIYDAVEFELNRPWEIRIYLEVLAMHDLVNLQDDQWVPSDYFRPTDRAETEE